MIMMKKVVNRIVARGSLFGTKPRPVKRLRSRGKKGTNNRSLMLGKDLHLGRVMIVMGTTHFVQRPRRRVPQRKAVALGLVGKREIRL
jgi:hypothetical protein